MCSDRSGRDAARWAGYERMSLRCDRKKKAAAMKKERGRNRPLLALRIRPSEQAVDREARQPCALAHTGSASARPSCSGRHPDAWASAPP